MMSNERKSVLKLTVNNHAGVMSHVCGLFARRAYNLDSILVMPIAAKQGKQSTMWLLVDEEDKLDQVINQTAKLVDVLDIERSNTSGSIFEKIEQFA